MPKAVPQRSCISCKETKNKDELFRFVLAPDYTLVIDLLDKLPGRGAYTCSKLTCLRNAASRKQFARAFKCEVSGAETETIVPLVVSKMTERISSYLSLANKAGKVVSGTDQVSAELNNLNTPVVLFVASDISPGSRNKISALASKVGVTQVDIFDKEQLGSFLGKEMRTVAAIQNSDFVGLLTKELIRYRNFFEGGRE
jgi:predicted RNA-binding protein YlxR (DUF448 family)/ribosomal protein L30E